MLGIGPKNFREICKNYKTFSKYDLSEDGCSTHPHNTMMQILAETGFLGFIFYLIGFFFIFLKIFQFRKKYNDNPRIFCFLSCSLAIIINLFPFLCLSLTSISTFTLKANWRMISRG